jgi:ribosomal protein S18 acetylase RimI-like enzyme
VSVELRSARTLTQLERTELFNRAYEGYVVPFVLSEELLAFMDETYDIDLDASRIAYRDGEAVGLGNLGVRGEDAWIGGVGVVKAARREGIGEILMRALQDEARARGVVRVWLEVIEQNTGAFALYEKLGYRTVRDVEVWSLAATVEPGDGEQVSLDVASTLLPAEREPWQRADASVAKQPDVQALAHESGAAIFRLVDGRVSLLQIGGERLEELLRALRAYGPVHALNLPRDGAAARAFAALGGTLIVRQHEMLLEP